MRVYLVIIPNDKTITVETDGSTVKEAVESAGYSVSGHAIRLNNRSAEPGDSIEENDTIILAKATGSAV